MQLKKHPLRLAANVVLKSKTKNKIKNKIKNKFETEFTFFNLYSSSLIFLFLKKKP
jgi:hypothetical protein